MKTRISALMDGELEDHELAETLRALRRSARNCAANGANWPVARPMPCAANVDSTSMSQHELMSAL